MLTLGRKKLESKKMMRLLMIVLSLPYVLFSLLNAEGVEAYVNTQEVVKGNAVQFTIQASGGKAAFPVIRNINGVVVTESGTSTSTSMQISSSGMKRESKTTKQYIFVPEHDMVIPAYTVRVGSKKFKTQAITIKVVQSKAPQMTKSDDYSFVMKSSKKTMVVGESFVLTLFLSLSDRLGVQQVSEYKEPSSEAFFFKDMGKQKQYKRGNVSVVEKQYSVTAKKAGHFNISAASAKVGITDRSRQDLFGRFGIRWIDVMSNSIKLEVKAQKIETDLVGVFAVMAKMDKQKVKANKPVNLTIQIKGKGNLEDFVFPNYEIDGVTIYEDEAQVESHIEAGNIVSVYRKNFVFIGEESFTIPKRTISLYNTETKEVEVLEVQSYEVSIERKKLLGTILPTFTSTPSPQVEQKEHVKEVEVKSTNVWMLALAFVLGAMFMYVTQRVMPLFKKKENPYTEREALKLLYAHIGEGKEVEVMVHQLYAKKNGDTSVKIDKKALKTLVTRFR